MGKLSPKIFKHWVQSYEENTKDERVYRPVGYDFPPVRGREGFEIKENNEFIQYKIGPDDRPKILIGQWEAERYNKINVFFKDHEVENFTIYITFCDEQILRIKQ